MIRVDYHAMIYILLFLLVILHLKLHIKCNIHYDLHSIIILTHSQPPNTHGFIIKAKGVETITCIFSNKKSWNFNFFSRQS